MLPDVITYSALITACEKAEHPERAFGIFQAMQRQGLLPNIFAYSALLSACGKG